jgi:Tannase and feruloyl esterase
MCRITTKETVMLRDIRTFDPRCAGASVALVLVAASAHAGGPCSVYLGQTIEGARITLAQDNPASGTLPSHCEIVASIAERTGIDGLPYAIRLRLRMPAAWNGRYYQQGGSGTDGALGAADAPQLGQGYAVAATDSGHDNAVNTSALAGTFQFGFDPQARSDYGYNGPARTAVAAKAIVARYYDQAPAYAYFEGCSEGGREGLMLSQRYPDLFNGIVSGNPGMDLPRAAVAEAWDTQAFAGAARTLTSFGYPDLASSFNSTELGILGNAITAACDTKDGLADGMIFNPQACTFDPATLGPAGTGQLSGAQVTALQKVFGGAKNSAGEDLYAGWYWDPGIAAQGWRVWKIGPLFTAPGNTGLNATLGGGALPFIFTSPPNSATGGTSFGGSTVVTTAGPDPTFPGLNDAFMPWVLSFNFDTDAPKISARTAPFTESAMDFMGTSSTVYRDFRALGRKLIVYTGQADPVFSAKYHATWYRLLADRNGGYQRVQGFARLFMVPGMNHCSGGPSTSVFDSFKAIVDWVERGRAPKAIVATAPADTPWPGRTRPLCPFPTQARYKGVGSTETAANFNVRRG